MYKITDALLGVRNYEVKVGREEEGPNLSMLDKNKILKAMLKSHGESQNSKYTLSNIGKVKKSSKRVILSHSVIS